MGMIDLTGILGVTVNGIPLAAGPFSAITSVSVTDASGFTSDSCEILVANTGLVRLFGMPSPGAQIGIVMGGRPMGLFIADEIEESEPPRQIRIVGRSKSNGVTDTGAAPIAQHKNRTWAAGLTMGAIVETIAGENGLKPGATESAAAIVPGHIDQVDESDIALLTRLARRFDLIAKPAGGVLFVGKKGEGVQASGGLVPVVPLVKKQVSSWSMRRRLEGAKGSVVATYRDLASGKNVEVTEGKGEPVRRLKSRFKDKEAAKEAAKTELARLKRMVEALNVTMPGNPLIAADGRILPADFSLASQGEWLVQSVTHTTGPAGFTTSFSAERPE